MNNPFNIPSIRIPQSYTATSANGNLPTPQERNPPVLRPLTREELQRLFKARGIVEVRDVGNNVGDAGNEEEEVRIGNEVEGAENEEDKAGNEEKEAGNEEEEAGNEEEEAGNEEKEVGNEEEEAGNEEQEVGSGNKVEGAENEEKEPINEENEAGNEDNEAGNEEEEARSDVGIGNKVEGAENEAETAGNEENEAGKEENEAGNEEKEAGNDVGKGENEVGKVFDCMISVIKKRGKMKSSLRFSKMEEFVDACSYGVIDRVVYILFKKDFNVNDELLHGMSALQHACYNGQNEVVKLLLDLGANPNYRRKWDNFTPLMAAACYCEKETPKLMDCVKAVVEAGGNVTAANRNLYTPLHFAVKRRHVRMVEYLLENGANMLHEDEDGETPWNIVFDTKDVATLKVLSRYRFPSGGSGDIFNVDICSPQDTDFQLL